MKIVFFSLVLVLAGCSATQPISLVDTTHSHSDTMEIIRSAAEFAPNGVKGEYILKVKAAGNQGPFVYLNTELDYRDQRSVTVAIHPKLIPLFVAKYGTTPQKYLVDKSISVTGQAKRIKIDFTSQGKPSGKYYYQTHIRVMDISQIKVVNEHA
ncbi:hypothetical protein [uncultured Paraglaciecola sp.]|jgi:hypothetical protein|uniref:hypothetical protein n=1 Tax=uncultured Paraglaciecola sp. TaxID=1765024 RepID=UPI0025D1A9F3|nr:hypothetical protein [uncultured Paraglaciecola sp.]